MFKMVFSKEKSPRRMAIISVQVLSLKSRNIFIERTVCLYLKKMNFTIFLNDVMKKNEYVLNSKMDKTKP